MLRLTMLLAAMGLFVSACGSASGHGVSVSGSKDERPTIALPDRDPPAELVTEDLVIGEGAEFTAGTQAVVHYVGVSWTTKAVFDASWGRTPFPVEVGAEQVIAGWDEGLVGMRVGGRRLLIIPPDKGYGEAGAGEVIPPNDTLVFVVDAIEVGGGS